MTWWRAFVANQPIIIPIVLAFLFCLPQPSATSQIVVTESSVNRRRLLMPLRFFPYNTGNQRCNDTDACCNRFSGQASLEDTWFFDNRKTVLFNQVFFLLANNRKPLPWESERFFSFWSVAFFICSSREMHVEHCKYMVNQILCLNSCSKRI